jgi:hypothetical protein
MKRSMQDRAQPLLHAPIQFKGVQCIPVGAIALQTGRPKDKARLLQFIESGTLSADRFQNNILERHALAGS